MNLKKDNVKDNTQKKMAYKRFIVLIIGKSGSGKTYVANMLNNILGWKTVQSYTTRPKRHENENGHTFVSEAEIPLKKEMVAYTEFDGYKYWATKQQVEDCQTYIVDAKGLEDFKKRYKGEKRIVTLYVACDEATRERRMLARGDKEHSVISRIYHDREAFKEFESNPDNWDVTLYNGDISVFNFFRRLGKAVEEIEEKIGKKLVKLD